MLKKILVLILIFASMLPIFLAESDALEAARGRPEPPRGRPEPPRGQPEPPPFVANQVLVSFQPGVTTPDIATFYAEHNLIEKKRLGRGPNQDSRLRLAQVRPPAEMDEPEEFLRKLNQDSKVNFAELNFILTLADGPNDSQFGGLWGLNNTGQSGGTADADIDAHEAWGITTGSASVIVGVIDTGVDYTHEDLAANMWVNPGETAGNGIDDDGNGYVDDVYGINAITGSGDPMDDHGHGTHVSGTIGSVGDNGIGVAGVNWDVSIVACKFLDAQGGGTTDGAIECFLYFKALQAAGNDIRMTNNSWGGGGFSNSLQNAMKGSILHATAAGNGGFDGLGDNNDLFPHYPSNYNLPNIISVAATDRNDFYAVFSNYGVISVDLAAPGVDILSTVPAKSPTGNGCGLCNKSGYATYSGTSMATPHVAGSAALIWSADSSLSALDVKDLLLAGVDPLIGVDPLGFLKETATDGRLNVGVGPLAPPPPPAGSISGTVSDGASIPIAGVPVTVDTGHWALTNASGNYTIDNVPVGSRSVCATAPGYQSGLMSGVSVDENITQEGVDFDLGNPAGGGIFSDDLESATGCFTATGLWHLADDTNCVNPDSGYESATHSFYYGRESSCDYTNGSNPSQGKLTSPVISLEGYSSPALEYNYWRGVEFFDDPDFNDFFDKTYVEASYDGGATWNLLWDWDSRNSSSRTWLPISIALPNASTVQVRFTFDTRDGVANDFEGWLIDDITVTGTLQGSANAAPVAADDSYSTDEDTGLNVPASGVLAGDTDADDDPLTAVLVADPANGLLTLNSDGSFSYMPDADFNGSDSFTYKANDGSADSNDATVSINVNEVNDAPVALADSYSTTENVLSANAFFNVLTNDTDVDGDSLSAVLVDGSGPSNGTLALNPGGTFTYTPAAGFIGADSFDYMANDGTTDSNYATVSITVDPANAAPEAADDSYATDEDSGLDAPVLDGVLANDDDSDGNPLTAVLVTDVADGVLILNTDGSFSYTPDGDFNGNDSFIYRANDGLADSNDATVSITVNAVNDAPVAGDDSYSTDEDTALNVLSSGVLADDTDADGNSLTAVLVADPSNGLLTLKADGSFDYVPAAGFIGSDSFIYKANDGTADSNDATVSITVNATTADTVTILKANYNWKKQQLSLDATSSEGGSVTLDVYIDGGFAGTLVYKSKQNKHSGKITDVSSKPSVVEIKSSGKGSASIGEKDIGGKGG